MTVPFPAGAAVADGDGECARTLIGWYGAEAAAKAREWAVTCKDLRFNRVAERIEQMQREGREEHSAPLRG